MNLMLTNGVVKTGNFSYNFALISDSSLLDDPI
jgi:hypothetical protein